MKNILIPLCLTAILWCNFLQAQTITISAGTIMTITAGESFTSDGLTLIPSSDYTLSSVTLNRNAVAINPISVPYIARTYSYSDLTMPFSGTMRFNYLPAELNGLNEASLMLYAHDGISWQTFTSTTNDQLLHYVISSPLSGVPLSELTLVSSSALPLNWRNFTATRRGNNVLLQWSTFSEQNTRDFVAQQSTDGSNWSNIGTVPAAGKSNSITNYSYVHAYPAPGINYYRILQTDKDDKSSLSSVRTIIFNTTLPSFTIMANPVTNGILQVQVNVALPLSLYSDDGQLIWKKQMTPGPYLIDVSRYAKRIYFLKSNETTYKILIQ